MRTLVPLVLLLCSCASFEGASSNVAGLKTDMTEGGQRVASATVRGAEAVGESVGTAYRGVTNGFQNPADDAYGPYPRDYADTIRKHMLRFEGVKETSSFQFGKPVRSYLNKGLLYGGEIEWQGWVVDLAVETKARIGEPRVDEYVVRMKDGEVVEVLEKDYATAFHRVPAPTAPVPAAAAR